MPAANRCAGSVHDTFFLCLQLDNSASLLASLAVPPCTYWFPMHARLHGACPIWQPGT